MPVVNLNYPSKNGEVGKPNPTQAEFHSSPVKYRYLQGGAGSGKTIAGCFEAIKLSIEYPDNLGLVCRLTHDSLKQSTMRTFFEVCPPALIENYYEGDRKAILRAKNGTSEILFRGLDDPLKFGGMEFGFFYIDEGLELKDDSVFLMLKNRLRRNQVTRHCGIITSNPPGIDHWLYRWFFKNADNNHKMWIMSMLENKDNLPEDYVRDMLNYPGDWKRRYVDGEFGFLGTGRPVYPEFDRYRHVRTCNYLPYRDVHVGLDFGRVHPAAVFAQFDDYDRLMIIRADMGDDISADRYADHILYLCNRFYSDSQIYFYGDPAGRAKTDKSERTTFEIFASKGIQIKARVSSPLARIEIISRKLRTLIEGIPEIIIDQSCRILIDGFSGGYHREEDSDDPKKDGYWEHCQDALGYMVIHLFSIAGSLHKHSKTPSFANLYFRRASVTGY